MCIMKSTMVFSANPPMRFLTHWRCTPRSLLRIWGACRRSLKFCITEVISKFGLMFHVWCVRSKSTFMMCLCLHINNVPFVFPIFSFPFSSSSLFVRSSIHSFVHISFFLSYLPPFHHSIFNFSWLVYIWWCNIQKKIIRALIKCSSKFWSEIRKPSFCWWQMLLILLCPNCFHLT